MNLVLQIGPICGQGGGRGSKIPKILRTYLMEAPSSDDGGGAEDIDNIFGGEGKGMQRGEVRARSAYSRNNFCFVLV